MRIRFGALLAGSGMVVGLTWVGGSGGLGPTKAQACTLGLAIDEQGGRTASQARARYADTHQLDIDVGQPDEVRERPGRSDAAYRLDSPVHPPATAGRTYWQRLDVVRGEDGVWRVTNANTCARWSE